jgi:DNA-binding MarR family transcriptional regulator
MDPQYVLTETEARVLLASGIGSETMLSEMAVATRLTPSELRQVVERLEQKGFMRRIDGGPRVWLTQDGQSARALLRQQRMKQAVQQSRTGPQVVILPDEASSPGPAAEQPRDWDIEDLDRAIEEELRKHRSP